MKRTAMAIAFSLMAATNPTGAFAQPESQTHQIAVEYGDLDLAKPAGQATLDKRLARAIDQVCDPGWTRSVRVASETRACIAQKHAELAPTRARLIAEARSKTTAPDLAARPR